MKQRGAQQKNVQYVLYVLHAQYVQYGAHTEMVPLSGFVSGNTDRNPDEQHTR